MKAIDPYKEQYLRSPNHGGKIAPKYIILHHTAGSFSGSVDWCRRAESKVSYHYIIDPEDGSRVQLVYDTKRAWHAGKSKWGAITDLNTHSIGIAFAGDTNKREVAAHEITSCAHKCIYLMDKFGIPLDSILTHQMIAPGRKNDCSAATHAEVVAKIQTLQK